MFKKILLSFTLVVAMVQVYAFCGFYVAQSSAKIFNKSSQVIMVRNGDRTVITMANDFQGDVKNFAMIIPVPHVITQDRVKVINNNIFHILDGYSGPRLVEYRDQAPCQIPIPTPEVAEIEDEMIKSESAMMLKDLASDSDYIDYKVQIKEEFKVDEYDIVILSAEESDGLERWLTDNGYKIPQNAKEALEPYIKNNMNFFVVKVNLESNQKVNPAFLRPLQITVNTDKFMLPIRLGMANADGKQDLLVYMLTQTGRVETVNYRTKEIPTDRNIPEFVQQRFDGFYVDMFKRTCSKSDNRAVFLEYAWDISGGAPVKCDPCAGPPPLYKELAQAGVNWLTPGQGYFSGSVFFTRLHVRYDRKHFPQDLQFQETPNREKFQGRYVITHPYRNPYGGKMTCDAAEPYYRSVVKRRKEEMKELRDLTGWDLSAYPNYVSEFSAFLPKPKPQIKPVSNVKPPSPSQGMGSSGLNEKYVDSLKKAVEEKINPQVKASEELPPIQTKEEQGSEFPAWPLWILGGTVLGAGLVLVSNQMKKKES